MRIEHQATLTECFRLRQQLSVAVKALERYKQGNHFDTVNGRTRIIDTGAIAEEALLEITGSR